MFFFEFKTALPTKEILSHDLSWIFLIPMDDIASRIQFNLTVAPHVYVHPTFTTSKEYFEMYRKLLVFPNSLLNEHPARCNSKLFLLVWSYGCFHSFIHYYTTGGDYYLFQHNSPATELKMKTMDGSFTSYNRYLIAVQYYNDQTTEPAVDVLGSFRTKPLERDAMKKKR